MIGLGLPGTNNGITLTMEDRGIGVLGRRLLSNVTVRHNTIISETCGSRNGVVDLWNGTGQTLAQLGVRFDYNKYILAGSVWEMLPGVWTNGFWWTGAMTSEPRVTVAPQHDAKRPTAAVADRAGHDREALPDDVYVAVHELSSDAATTALGGQTWAAFRHNSGQEVHGEAVFLPSVGHWCEPAQLARAKKQ